MWLWETAFQIQTQQIHTKEKQQFTPKKNTAIKRDHAYIKNTLCNTFAPQHIQTCFAKDAYTLSAPKTQTHTSNTTELFHCYISETFKGIVHPELSFKKKKNRKEKRKKETTTTTTTKSCFTMYMVSISQIVWSQKHLMINV